MRAVKIEDKYEDVLVVDTFQGIDEPQLFLYEIYFCKNPSGRLLFTLKQAHRLRKALDTAIKEMQMAREKQNG